MNYDVIFKLAQLIESLLTNITSELLEVFMGLTVKLEHPVGHCLVSAVTGEHVTVPAVDPPEMSCTVSPLVKPLVTLLASEV